MKKIFIYGAVVAAVAGCSAKKADDVKIFDASCEKSCCF